MIDPKAEPIGHRPPYKPIDVSGRKPAPSDAKLCKPYEWWLQHFKRYESDTQCPLTSP